MDNSVLIYGLLLIFGALVNFTVSQSHQPPLPPGVEIVNPKDLGLSEEEVQKFIGNVHLMHSANGNIGSSNSQSQILSLGVDPNGKVNLNNLKPLPTKGLSGADKMVSEMAGKTYGMKLKDSNPPKQILQQSNPPTSPRPYPFQPVQSGTLKPNTQAHLNQINQNLQKQIMEMMEENQKLLPKESPSTKAPQPQRPIKTEHQFHIMTKEKKPSGAGSHQKKPESEKSEKKAKEKLNYQKLESVRAAAHQQSTFSVQSTTPVVQSTSSTPVLSPSTNKPSTAQTTESAQQSQVLSTAQPFPQQIMVSHVQQHQFPQHFMLSTPQPSYAHQPILLNPHQQQQILGDVLQQSPVQFTSGDQQGGEQVNGTNGVPTPQFLPQQFFIQQPHPNMILNQPPMLQHPQRFIYHQPPPQQFIMQQPHPHLMYPPPGQQPQQFPQQFQVQHQIIQNPPPQQGSQNEHEQAQFIRQTEQQYQQQLIQGQQQFVYPPSLPQQQIAQAPPPPLQQQQETSQEEPTQFVRQPEQVIQTQPPPQQFFQGQLPYIQTQQPQQQYFQPQFPAQQQFQPQFPSQQPYQQQIQVQPQQFQPQTTQYQPQVPEQGQVIYGQPESSQPTGPTYSTQQTYSLPSQTMVYPTPAGTEVHRPQLFGPVEVTHKGQAYEPPVLSNEINGKGISYEEIVKYRHHHQNGIEQISPVEQVSQPIRFPQESSLHPPLPLATPPSFFESEYYRSLQRQKLEDQLELESQMSSSLRAQAYPFKTLMENYYKSKLSNALRFPESEEPAGGAAYKPTSNPVSFNFFSQAGSGSLNPFSTTPRSSLPNFRPENDGTPTMVRISSPENAMPRRNNFPITPTAITKVRESEFLRSESRSPSIRAQGTHYNKNLDPNFAKDYLMVEMMEKLLRKP